MYQEIKRTFVENIDSDTDFKALCKYFPSTSYSLTFPLSPPLCLDDTECYDTYVQSYMFLSNPLYYGTALKGKDINTPGLKLETVESDFWGGYLVADLCGDDQTLTNEKPIDKNIDASTTF